MRVLVCPKDIRIDLERVGRLAGRPASRLLSADQSVRGWRQKIVRKEGGSLSSNHMQQTANTKLDKVGREGKKFTERKRGILAQTGTNHAD